MRDNQSIADRFVRAMECVRRIDDEITTDHPTRHTYWSLKNVAEQALTDGIEQALRIARIADALRYDEQRAAEEKADAAAQEVGSG